MNQHPALQFLRLSEKGKVVSAAEAVRLIRDGDTVATGGFVGIGFAEEIALALEALYLETKPTRPTRKASRRTSHSFTRPARATARNAGSTTSRMTASSSASSAAIGALRRNCSSLRYQTRSRPITCRRA
jgi:acyl CoA:acetate/3-ketoacid CoA transferase